MTTLSDFGARRAGARWLVGLLLAVVCAVVGWAEPPRPISVTVSPEPSVYGQPFTLTANIVWPYSASSGTVAFSIDGTAVGTSAVDSSFTATFVVTTATITGDLNNPIYWVGTHQVTAVLLYNGGEEYAEAVVSHAVVGQASEATITSLDQNIYYGQEIGYDFGVDAILSAAPADPATAYGNLDGGELDTYIDTTLVCTLSYNVGGRCLDAPFEGYQVGTYETYVIYNGNDYFAPSASPMYPVTVMQDTTATTLATSANPSIAQQVLTLAATVAASYPGALVGTVFPTVVGTVQFFDGLTAIGTATVNAQGVATLPVATLLVGTHTLTACYVNSLNFMPSCSAPVTQVVKLVNPPVATVTLLTSGLNPSLVGQAVTLTAAVETTGAFVQTPSGSVSFYDGSTLLGTVSLNGQGIATLTTAALAAGVHAITADYSGNAAATVPTGASVSAVVDQVVLVSLPPENGYLLIVTPTAVSVRVGSSVTLSVVVAGVNPSGQRFQLSCGQLPSGVTCAFGQSSLPVNGGATTVTIATMAPHACGANAPYFAAGGARPISWLAVVGVFWFGVRRRKLRAMVVLGCLGLAVALMPVAGCGGCTDLGTQPLGYHMLVNATAVGVANSNPYATESQAVGLNVHL